MAEKTYTEDTKRCKRLIISNTNLVLLVVVGILDLKLSNHLVIDTDIKIWYRVTINIIQVDITN